MRVGAALLSISFLAGVVGPAHAQSAAPGEALVPMHYVRTDLRQVVQRVAPLLGERIIYDTALSGRVTIAVPRPVSREEAWELLHAALALNGFVAAPVASGGFKIIPLPQATASDPWTLAEPVADGESRIVTLLPVHNIPVNELREILTPLLDPQTLAIPTATGNSLILATTQRRLAAIMRLAHELDLRPLRDLEIATLKERDAALVADVLRKKYDEVRGNQPIVEIWVDERTNSVLFRAPPALIEDVRAVVDQMDQPVVGRGEIQVIPLSYAAAEDVAQRLQDLSAAPGGTGPDEGSGLAGAQLNVVADPATSSLVVNAAPDTMQRVRDIVALLDQPPRQIEIDAVVLEWVYDESSEFRIVAASQFDLPGMSVGSAQMTPTSFVGAGQPRTDALTVDVTRGLNRFNVIAEAQSSVGRTLMRPHTIALSGEEQSFFSGNEIPVFTAAIQEGGGDNPFTQRRTVERRDVGIELRVRPTIGANFDTQLEVDVEIDALSASVVSGTDDPTFTQRDIHTVAQLSPGAAVVIGTFSKPFTTQSRVGVPFLMNLPVVGQLFSQTVETRQRTHIMIAVQARPLPDSRARIANSIRRRVALERATARERTIPEASSGAFALRVTSELTRALADELAQRLDSEAHPANVLRWTQVNLSPVYDVQLLGFGSYEEAAEEAYRLYGEGFHADVLAISGADGLLD